MSESRSIRFQQIRLITGGTRAEMLSHAVRPSAQIMRTRNRLPPPLLEPECNVSAHPKKNATGSDVSLDENVVLGVDSASAFDEGGNHPGDEDAITHPGAGGTDSDANVSFPANSSRLADEADQRVTEISTMSIVRSIALDEAFQMIADSVARISNDEANDRNGPWYFEMNCATHQLPSTTLFIELSREELLLRFLSLDAATVRLILRRKQDLQSRLVSQLRPARSVQIEIVSE